jgi:DnaJ family protein C protein 2
VQNAYETLIDLDKRKKYDSTLPFDDSIPNQENMDISDDNFYEVFKAVYMRNARFAKKKPVPNLGDDTTPIE